MLNITNHQGNHQIKTTMRYHFTPVKMAIIKKRQDLTSVGKDVEKREPLYTAGRNVQIFQPLWKTVRRFLKKLQIELPYDPAILLILDSNLDSNHDSFNYHFLFSCLDKIIHKIHLTWPNPYSFTFYIYTTVLFIIYSWKFWVAVSTLVFSPLHLGFN